MSDGRTLTGELLVAGVPTETDGFALVFGKRDGTARRYEVGVVQPTSGRVRIAVPLEGPGSVDLRQGKWCVGLTVTTGSDARTLPLRGGGDIDERGPTLWNPRSPVTGRRYRPGVDNAGDLTLTVRGYAPHAEVDRVAVRGASVEITGRLIGKGVRNATGAATVVLHQAATGEQCELPARITKRNFTFVLPEDLSWRTEQRATWSATLHPSSGGALDVKKCLSDLRDVAGVIGYPAAVLLDGATLVPGYAADGSLVFTIIPPSQEPGSSGASESSG